MSPAQTSALPLQRALEALEAWQADPSPRRRSALGASLDVLLGAYGVAGAYLELDAPLLPTLELGLGTLSTKPGGGVGRPVERQLAVGGADGLSARLWLDGAPRSAGLAARAIELALQAGWSKAEARSQSEQLAALDAAVRGIAGVLPVERVLQLIVDRVCELVSAEYAALGIVNQFGGIEKFVTSGISHEQRAKIGDLPHGRGLLGLIIREDRSFLIDDIATDPRRYGFPAHHPPMHSFLGVPVRSKGVSVGNLYLTNKQTAPTFTDADQRLVEMFGLHAGIAIENARLHEQVQRLAVVDERQRISQDLHDSVIQSLYAVTLSLEDLPEIIGEEPAEGAARADRAIEAIHGTIRDIRNFIMGLQPELLEEADLTVGINSLAAEFRANTLIDLELRLDEPPAELSVEQAGHVLAMTREALSNVARHSGATRASVELINRDGTLGLVISDNGRGMDVNEARRAGQHGLANLQARAEALGGALSVASEPGAGTRLEAEIPVGRTAGR